MSKGWDDERTWTSICVLVFLCWISIAHGWAIKSIFPEYEKPDLVEDYVPTYNNWRQHLRDMEENRVKEQYASSMFEFRKSVTNRRFYESTQYWFWFAPMALLGGGVLLLAKLKGGRYWKIKTIKNGAKYAVLIWLATSMWPDPLRLHSPLLATIVFFVLVLNGFGVDPVSSLIQKRVNKLEGLSGLAEKYNKMILGLAIIVIVGFQIKLGYSYYWQDLDNDGFSGWWVRPDLWEHISEHVRWFCRSLLAVILSFSTVGSHYISFEIANLVDSAKEEDNGADE
ncbi:hypothetical protein [Alcanivorax sp.]|uniref:hypothetical protein n=1 Tax=Alcanivorax sp. TaxID=1872427 RepID=UPI0025C19351|nr:hypothetical protein [Alcanivorax sp.]